MKFLSFLLISFSLFSCSSLIPVEVEDGKALGIMPMRYGHIYYQGTHKINASREDIFRQVRRWAAFRSTRSIFSSPYTIIKVPAPTAAFSVSDNLLGDVIATGIIERIPRNSGSLFWPSAMYSVSIEAYEGSYRLTLTNFYSFGMPSAHYMDFRDKATSLKITREYYSEVDREAMKVINELNTFVEGEIKSLPAH
ncbi:hypothetical protein GCM10028807_52030 [Spirosoma daeguense]